MYKKKCIGYILIVLYSCLNSSSVSSKTSKCMWQIKCIIFLHLLQVLLGCIVLDALFRWKLAILFFLLWALFMVKFLNYLQFLLLFEHKTSYSSPLYPKITAYFHLKSKNYFLHNSTKYLIQITVSPTISFLNCEYTYLCTRSTT